MLPGHLSSSPVFIGVRVVHRVVLCVVYCRLFITTKIVCSNPVHGEVNSIPYYVIKFVSDLQRVGGFLLVLRFPSPIKLTSTI